MKIWFWWGLMLCQSPFLHAAHPISSPAGRFSIARQIFPLCIFQLPFCFLMCAVKVSPYLEHALNLHREQGAGREGRALLQQLQPWEKTVCCFPWCF